MSTQLKLRRGTTAQHSTFTGASGEITVDTTKKTVVVHDGTTAGGVPLAKESDVAGFLTSATAASTYQTQAGMSSYLTSATAASTYLTSATAASTYAPLASPTFSGDITASSGTANGVAYLNGSKVLITGSALTFDGTNLGVGTTTPSAFLGKLTVAGNSAIALGGKQYFWDAASASGTYITNSGGTSISFGLYSAGGDAEQMRLTSTGLGIGTSSPQKKLVVSDGGASGIELSPNDAGLISRILSYNRSTSVYQDLLLQANLFKFGVGSSGTEAMTLDSSGNLGLGVTPSAWGSGYTPIQGAGYSLYSGNTVQMRLSANEYFSSTASTYRVNGAAALYQQSSGNHAWYTAPSGTAGNAISFTQAMTLDASGNLVVGGTSALGATTGRGNITLNGSTDAILSFGNSATLSGYILSAGSGMYFDAQSTRPLIFSNNGSERMRIDSSGNVVIKTGSLQEVKTAIAASAIDLSTGNYFTKTISGATTFTVSNVPASGTVGAFVLELTNGGSATVTWFSGVKWASGTAPTLTAAGVDIIAFYTHDGGTTWRGAVVAKDSK